MAVRVYSVLICVLFCACTPAQEAAQDHPGHDDADSAAARAAESEDPFDEENKLLNARVEEVSDFGLSLHVSVSRDQAGDVFVGYCIVNDSGRDVLISPDVRFSWESLSGLPSLPKGALASSAGGVLCEPGFSAHYVLLRPRRADSRKSHIFADNQGFCGRRKMGRASEFKGWRDGQFTFDAHGDVLVWDPKRGRFEKCLFSTLGTCAFGADGIPLASDEESGESDSTAEPREKDKDTGTGNPGTQYQH